MEHVDRVADVQGLAEPSGTRRPFVESQSLRLVLRAERLHRIGGHDGIQRHLRQEPPVGSAELERAIGTSLDLIALLVRGSMMSATPQRQVRQRRRAALGPMARVMALAEGQSAAPTFLAASSR